MFSHPFFNAKYHNHIVIKDYLKITSYSVTVVEIPQPYAEPDSLSALKAELLRDRAAVPAPSGLHGSFLMQHDLPEGIHGGGDSQELLDRTETGPVLPLCRIQRSALQR